MDLLSLISIFVAFVAGLGLAAALVDVWAKWLFRQV